jgi:hypothetical protein
MDFPYFIIRQGIGYPAKADHEKHGVSAKKLLMG